ncbi:MAG TPA: hypothetical protein VFB45_10285 [Pseudolabrys sp.]|nr:hypothetical protein [Pseudolabrys sp.]
MLRWENVKQCHHEADACRQYSVAEDSADERLLWLRLAEAWEALAKDLVTEAGRPH